MPRDLQVDLSRRSLDRTGLLIGKSTMKGYSHTDAISRVLVHLLGPFTYQSRMFGICSTSRAQLGSGATRVALYCSRRGGLYLESMPL